MLVTVNLCHDFVQDQHVQRRKKHVDQANSVGCAQPLVAPFCQWIQNSHRDYVKAGQGSDLVIPLK